MDFKIDIKAVDLDSLHQIWGLPDTTQIIEITAFGDFFTKDKQGLYWLYSLTDGEIKEVSREINEFGLPPVEVALGDEWYQLDAQSVLAEEKRVLDENQCFGFKQPVFKQGDYSLENIEVVNICQYSQRIHGFMRQNDA